MWCIVGGEVLKNGGGGLLRNLMLEGDPEVPFTSPSAISRNHMASALAEQSGRPACGRESGPHNLYPQSNANFQFNTRKAGMRPHRAQWAGTVRVWSQLNYCWFKDGFCKAMQLCASSACTVYRAYTQLNNAFLLSDENKSSLEGTVLVSKGYSLSVGGTPPPEQC